MPRYHVEQYEIHVSYYTVEAESKAEAIRKVFDGDASSTQTSDEYIQVFDDWGMDVRDPAFVKELEKTLEFDLPARPDGTRWVPSIRAVEEF